MSKRIKRHRRPLIVLTKPDIIEPLFYQKGSIFLNIAKVDRISFAVLRNKTNNIRVVENISYEIFINGKWETVVRYDDHNGIGPLHRHIRISLSDTREVQSVDGIRKYKNKDFELTWVCNDIKRHYLNFRAKFLKNSGVDLY